MANMKAKGTIAERELIHKFWKNNWAAARVAGSGSMKYPSPDIIAGKDGHLFVIECKTTKNEKQYFEKKEIDELKEFAQIAAGIPYLAVKFKKNDWRFYLLSHLKYTGKNYVITTKEPYLNNEEIIKTSKHL